MPRPPIVLGGKTFPSTTAARDHMRALLRPYGGYPSRLAPADAAVVMDALAYHPDAATRFDRPAVAVEVRLNPPYMSPGMWLVYADGSSESFSVNAIFTANGTNKRQLVRKALRAEIDDQVQAVRAAHVWPVRCPLTGVLVERHEAHVDHAHPATFTALAEGWLTANGLTADAVATTRDPSAPTKTVLADRELAASWRAYHATHATLRVVSASANLLMGDRGSAPTRASA